MSTSLPNSPMMLDSTGQAVVAKLQGIISAINNGGGGGGGAAFTAPAYDTTIARHGQYSAYRYGDYCTYQDVIYRCITNNISVEDPCAAFDSTKWETFSSLAEELSAKPGRTVDSSKSSESYGNIPGNTSSGYYSHAEGSYTEASGDQSHAEGSSTKATNNQSHAEGSSTQATGPQSHAEGSSTRATQVGAHAEGLSTNSTGSGSHSEGSGTNAGNSYAHAEGYQTKALGSGSHAEGNYTVAGKDGYSTYGYSAHAEGAYTEASGDYSHAEDYHTKASGNYSHAEGTNTEATADAAHAEGYYTKARGSYSHTEGYETEVENGCYYGRATGYQSKCSGVASNASGYYVEAKTNYETAVGAYNESIDDGHRIDQYQNNNYKSYAVGDKVKVRINGALDGNIYQATEAIAAPAGEFDPSKWQIVGTYEPSFNKCYAFSVGNGNNLNHSNAFAVTHGGKAFAGGHELIAIDPPTTDGTYKLQCTVSSGVVTYAWVADV